VTLTRAIINKRNHAGRIDFLIIMDVYNGNNIRETEVGEQ
jgi:hypothetical protein